MGKKCENGVESKKNSIYQIMYKMHCAHTCTMMWFASGR